MFVYTCLYVYFNSKPYLSINVMGTRLSLTLFRLRGRGGGGGVDGECLTPSRMTASIVFLLRDFSSNLSGNNLVLSAFGS